MSVLEQLRLSREQARQIDQQAEVFYGIPSIVLMENAAIEASQAVLGLLAARHEKEIAANRVAILCGGGNNGGDGYALARHLFSQGIEVGVFAAVPVAKLTGDAKTQANTCKALGIAVAEVDSWPNQWALLKEVDVIVDGLLGSGFAEEVVRQPIRDAIDAINTVSRSADEDILTRPWVLALDVPSGLDCDTGFVAEYVVFADLTISFVAAKQGFATPNAQKVLGEVMLGQIGVPPGAVLQILKNLGGGCCQGDSGGCACKEEIA